ncbi:serine/threonine-protein kinase DCLK3 isoform X2 [Ahaetulla prasina]|uniref:serine/threonine-protein kinase DCLK3 isoform X2 n=1 Tax=Ahaetulla prasina TaxID=499056 RepID=UPI00264A027C|nr:serine/threonine-protein kinase DCLK3 isoform X2 [Ahaetulla prasina]
MPAAPPPLHPAAGPEGSCNFSYHHCSEPQGIFDPTLSCMRSRVTERILQSTCPPIAHGSYGKPYFGTNGFSSPFTNFRTAFHTIHSENSPVKPRIITVVKPCGHAVRKITLLLNRRSVQTFEQLIADISEALGFPRWKNDRVRKLYNLKGREIRSVSDFFREGDTFIAMGKEHLTLKTLEMAIHELYPDKPYVLLTRASENWEQPQKLKHRMHEKTSKLEKSLEPTVVNNCMDVISPKLFNKHYIKAQTRNRQEEKLRPKKRWIRDNWHGEHELKPTRKPKEIEEYFNKERNPESDTESSSDTIIRCEKCERERQLKQNLQKERQNDFQFRNRDLNVRACKRYHVEKPAKLRSCRKLLEHSVEEAEVTWKEAGCQSTSTTSHNHTSKDLEKQKRSIYRDQILQNQDEELGIMKTKPLESQHTIVGDIYELKKEHRKRSRMNQSCWLIKSSQADGEKQTKFQGEKKEVQKLKEGNTRDEKMEQGESKQMNQEREEKLKINKEEKNQCKSSDVKLRHDVSSRADMENCYEIGRTIGDGNFAVVMECHHRSTNQIYAMKIIDKSKLKGKEDMLENEILIIKSLSHPNIVSLIEVFESEEEIYLIMEYVPGGDLFDAIIESVKFTEHDAALMITDLCEALIYIHSKNIVHRDLKPENLLVQRNPDKTTTLKLADFGLAKQVVRPIFTVCGTPTYVAPEILAENAAKDLINRLLVVDPKKRYTAQQVLQHLWIHTAGKNNCRNLQSQMTINLEHHFRSQCKSEVTKEDS